MKDGSKTKNGMIIPTLKKWCDKLSLTFKRSAAFSVLTGYGKTSEAFGASAIRRAIYSSASYNKGFLRRFKRAVSRQFENSLLINTFYAVSKRLQTISLKLYGMFFATFGLYTVIMYLLRTYAFMSEDAQIRDLFVGAVLCAVSVPMLFTQRSLAEALGTSRLLRPVIMRVTGVSAESFEKTTIEVKYHSVSVIAGVVCGAVTYFLDPLYLLAMLAGVLVLWILMSYPEAGVVLSLVCVPFLSLMEHPSLTLAILVVLTAFSYFVKLLRGKRVISFELPDLFVLLFLITLLLSGFSVGAYSGMREALISAGLMLVYFLASNLVRSENWLRVTLSMCIASATVVSFIGLAESALGLARLDWIDTALFDGITGRATSVFENPNVLSSYLIMIIPITVAFCFFHSDKSVRVLCALCASVMLSCVIVTWSRGAWVGLAVGALLLVVSISARNIVLIPPAVGLTMIAAWLFPTSLGARLGNTFTLADTSNHYRVSIWEGVTDMLRECWYCGIGAGELNFRSAYLNFAVAGIEDAPHAHSLYLQIIVQMGVIGMIFLLAAVALSAQKVYTHSFDQRADRTTVLMALGCFAGVVALLVFGLFDNSWYNYRVMFVFWSFLGLASAAVNVGREAIRLKENVSSAHAAFASDSAELIINFRKGQS